MSIKMDRLKKARKEQAIANMLMRQTGLSATSKYKGLSLFNSIYSFYNDKESVICFFYFIIVKAIT